jgi:hypothetical protein
MRSCISKYYRDHQIKEDEMGRACSKQGGSEKYIQNTGRKIIGSSHVGDLYLYNRQLLAGYHLLLSDFGPYGIISMNVCVVITIVMVMLFRDFGPCGIIFMTMCVYYFRFSRHS